MTGARIRRAGPDLYRQMDPENFCFPSRSAASATGDAQRHQKLSLEYSLTALGNSIIVPLRRLCRWARR